MPTPTPPSVRFWRRIDTSDPDACWLWPGTSAGTKGRYGTFQPGTRASDPKVYAHRFAYEDKVGPIPEGLEIDHLCRVRLCVNPAHLEPVTKQENDRRKRLTVCARGHDLTLDENCQWDAKGRRRGCLLCNRQTSREYAAQRYQRANPGCWCKNGMCRECREMR
jgi:hypothetical protein